MNFVTTENRSNQNTEGVRLEPSLKDYLFIQFGTAFPTLEAVCLIYFPHLCRAKQLEKARNMEFPFTCIKLDSSQKCHYIVDISELASVLNEKFFDAQKAKKYK